MQGSTFIIALFSLLALFSLALASPLPVQISNEVRESIVELSTGATPVDHNILHREVTDIGSGVNLQILAREHKSFDEYVQEMTGKVNTARDAQDLELRGCDSRYCI